MRKQLALPKNSTIICPACGLRIAKVAKDIFRYERIDASKFIPLAEGAVYDGMPFKCPVCFADYFLFGKFHVEEFGWLPNYV